MNKAKKQITSKVITVGVILLLFAVPLAVRQGLQNNFNGQVYLVTGVFGDKRTAGLSIGDNTSSTQSDWSTKTGTSFLGVKLGR